MKPATDMRAERLAPRPDMAAASWVIADAPGPTASRSAFILEAPCVLWFIVLTSYI